MPLNQLTKITLKVCVIVVLEISTSPLTVSALY